MRVAVVTPYYKETSAQITRCMKSVRHQTYSGDYVHMLVADGQPSYIVDLQCDEKENIEHMKLHKNHSDAGATPRAIGAISAFSCGFDAVAFLDADNTYELNHLELMTSTMTNSNCNLVSATRNICDKNGNFLYVDTIESDGTNFCDTNCIFIGKQGLNLLTYWITDENYRLWSDRHFWSAICQSGIKKTHFKTPTVNYYTKWAWHYQHAGLTPPTDSVWISSTDGSLSHQLHQNSI